MAELLDAITGAVMLFVFAIVLVVSLVAFDAVGSGGLFGTYATAFQKFYTAMNNVAIFIAVAISLGAVFSALLIKTHPAFFIVAVILVFVEFMITPTLVTTFNGIAQTMTATEQTNLQNMINILQYLPLLTAFGTFLAVIVGIMRD